MLQIFHTLSFTFFYEHFKIASFKPQSREVHISGKESFIAISQQGFSHRPWRLESCLRPVVLLSVCLAFVICRCEEIVNLILESFNDDCIYSQIHKILTFKPTLKKP